MTKDSRRKRHGISKRQYICVVLLMMAVLLVAVAGGCSQKPSEPAVTPTGEVTPEPTEAVTGTPEPPKVSEPTPEPAVEISKAQVGDTVQFGNYEQDNDTENGAEAIEWLVLDKQDGKLLLLSKYALDSKRYNEDTIDVTWETCTLRSWLNDTFYNTAFSAAEQEHIAVTKLENEDNPEFGIEGGNDTEDKIFLLSIGEVLKYFDSDPEAYDRTRCAKITAYAKAQGASSLVDGEAAGNGFWWMRSPGLFSSYATVVDNYGYAHRTGSSVDTGANVVRPAFWLNLEP